MVKNLPAMQETWVQFWFGKILWRRVWQPTPVFLHRESPWATVHRVAESDMTGQLSIAHPPYFLRRNIECYYLIEYSDYKKSLPHTLTPMNKVPRVNDPRDSIRQVVSLTCDFPSVSTVSFKIPMPFLKQTCQTPSCRLWSWFSSPMFQGT